MLNFFPELKETDYTSKHEFIFVVDRSGNYSLNILQFIIKTIILKLKA